MFDAIPIRLTLVPGLASTSWSVPWEDQWTLETLEVRKAAAAVRLPQLSAVVVPEQSSLKILGAGDFATRPTEIARTAGDQFDYTLISHRPEPAARQTRGSSTTSGGRECCVSVR